MVSFTLNGVLREEPQDMNLLTYLREARHLISVKNGCSEGACGTCTVLIDGKAAKACVFSLSKLGNKSIVTLEGLTDREKAIYGYSFAKCGAVQCGFCIPGMVMCAKGLIDANPNPTPQDVKRAIRGNICRCTGYMKIEQAILLAADIIAGRKQIEPDDDASVGRPLMRVDAVEKAIGIAEYCDDVFLDGCLVGKVLRAAYPRAEVLSLDTSRAKALDGVAVVMTAEDVPGSNIDGYMVKDVPTMVPVGEFTKCVGDAIAIVAADSAETARKALELIDVKYRVHQPVTNARDAMKPDAPKIHEKGNILSHTHLRCGDPDTAFQKAAHVVTQTVKLSGTDHAFLEPESSTAFYEGDLLVVYTTSQSVYHDKHSLCHILGLSEDELQVRSKYVGGAFGGKEDLHVQHFAALMCQATKRPVKVTASRMESMLFHPKRHPMEIEYSLACDENGNFTAARAKIIADTGAYASLGGAVVSRACSHAAGPYRLNCFEVDGYAVYTNNPPYGAFRGFGVPQICFANEIAVDLMAEELGMDKLDIRLQNALRPGDVMATGQLCEGDVAFIETLKAVEPAYRKALAEGKAAGIASALKNVGMGGGLNDEGRVRIRIENGKVVLYTAAQCMGQGLGTTMIQIAAEVLNMPASAFKVVLPNTETTPDAGATTASRQTAVTGEAAKMAALQLKAALESHALEDLEGRSFAAAHSPKTEPINCPNVQNPKSQVSYGYATHLVILSEDGKIESVMAAHDVGRAINPLNVEGQIEGGVVMGLGYALTEDFVVEDGFVKSRFGTIGLFRAPDVPPITVVIIEKSEDPMAFGAKGVGEIATIPTAPAVAAAYRARNGYFQFDLPLKDTPYAKKKS